MSNRNSYDFDETNRELHMTIAREAAQRGGPIDIFRK
jgi:hypothetical protein